MVAELSMLPALHLRALAATEGCGPECSDRFGHDPERHEAFGEERALRRMRKTTVRTGILTIDLTNRSVEVDGGRLQQLSNCEWLILSTLAERIGELVLWREIALAVYGREWVIATPHRASENVRAHLGRLRSRFGRAAALIETVMGQGLRLLDVPPGEVVAHPSWSRLRGRWSTQHDACTCCGRTDYPHNGMGLCTACGRPSHAACSGPVL